MKIVLVSPYANTYSIGLRILSSQLRCLEHDVQIAFLPQVSFRPYPTREVEELAAFVSSSDLVGISVMTDYFENSVQLTQAIRKRKDVPILWGGMHPTVSPEESLVHADMVCQGEGEESIIDLVGRLEKGGGWLDTPGFWFRDGGEIRRNPRRPPPCRLDSLPFPDFDWTPHVVWDGRGLVPMTSELMRRTYGSIYVTLATRGCPFACTYCCHHALRQGAEGLPPVRRRDLARVVQELVVMRSKMPFIDGVRFNDDAFLSYPEPEMEAFARLYRAEVGLPFFANGVHPSYVSREKMSFLVDAGLQRVAMGIQTGSPRTLKLYGRNTSPEKVIEAATVVHEFVGRTRMPRYDVILDNPWETAEDLEQTLMMLCRLPVPYDLSMFALALYPGTVLAEKAVRDGIVPDRRAKTGQRGFNVRIRWRSPQRGRKGYLTSLFHLVFVLAGNGVALSEETMQTLMGHRSGGLRRRATLLVLKVQALWLWFCGTVRRSWQRASAGNPRRGVRMGLYDFHVD